MEYLVFPFGKYKGEKLTDLPSTYIVMALEKFDLPEELTNELWLILINRLGVVDYFRGKLDKMTKSSFDKFLFSLKNREEVIDGNW